MVELFSKNKSFLNQIIQKIVKPTTPTKQQISIFFDEGKEKQHKVLSSKKPSINNFNSHSNKN